MRSQYNDDGVYTDEVDGRKVWAHWVWCKYGVDFLKPDGRWRIWRFRCFETPRAL